MNLQELKKLNEEDSDEFFEEFETFYLTKDNRKEVWTEEEFDFYCKIEFGSGSPGLGMPGRSELVTRTIEIENKTYKIYAYRVSEYCEHPDILDNRCGEISVVELEDE